MGERASIYVGEPLARLLDGHDNRSGRINNVAERYAAVVAQDRPQLTRAEWCAVCDALNGTWLADEPTIRFIWAEIADADRLNGLGAKWEIDAQDLARRIRDMPAGARVSLVETVEAFWRHADLPTDEALAQAGVV